MKRNTSALLIVTLLALTALPSAGWQKTVSKGKPGPYLKQRPVHLSYQVNWDGKINSGKIDMIFGKPDKRYPKHYIAQIYGGSTGVAKGLFPYSSNFNSFLRKTDYRPSIFVATETDRDEKRETVNRYGNSVTSKETVDPFAKGKATRTKTKTFSYSKSPIYDLLSAYFYLRSQDFKTGQKYVLVLQAFTAPYLATIHVRGREAHRGRKCVRMDLQLQKIGPKLNLIAYDKMKTATMWMSDDHERLPIEFRSEVFIGDIRVILVGLKYL